MQNIEQYKRAEVNTSDSVKIVTLLYDGAINFIRIAKKRMELGDIAGKGLYVGKATAIIGELTSSLNMKEGGEIAKNLDRLYDFVLDRLIQANLKNDIKAFSEAENILDILRGAWKELERGRVESAPKEATAGMALRV